MENPAESNDNSKGNFLTHHSRPIHSDDFLCTPSLEKDIAIVMQGPVVNEDNFTYETIKMYRRIFPNAKIVLSTWEGEIRSNLVKIADLGVVVLVNRKPAYPGIANINMQLRSTMSGLNWAAEQNCSFCLKTRTDMRIYNNKALTYFTDLLSVFPVIDDRSSQKNRIIFLSDNTRKYRTYSTSDLTVFGSTDDMLKYWNPPEEAPGTALIPKTAPMKAWSQSRYAEARFFSYYMEQLGYELDFSISQYWKFLAERFIVIDTSSVDAFWKKYDLHLENRYKNYGAERNSHILSFHDWLNLFASRENMPRPDERIQMMPWDSLIPQDYLL